MNYNEEFLNYIQEGSNVVPAENNDTPTTIADTTVAVSTTRTRRVRTSFTSEQTLVLEREFNSDIFLQKGRKFEIAQNLGLSPNIVKVWFQNRRMKVKKEKESLLLQSTITKPGSSGADVTSVQPKHESAQAENDQLTRPNHMNFDKRKQDSQDNSFEPPPKARKSMCSNNQISNMGGNFAFSEINNIQFAPNLISNLNRTIMSGDPPQQNDSKNSIKNIFQQHFQQNQIVPNTMAQQQQKQATTYIEQSQQLYTNQYQETVANIRVPQNYCAQTEPTFKYETKSDNLSLKFPNQQKQPIQRVECHCHIGRDQKMSLKLNLCPALSENDSTSESANASAQNKFDCKPIQGESHQINKDGNVPQYYQPMQTVREPSNFQPIADCLLQQNSVSLISDIPQPTNVGFANDDQILQNILDECLDISSELGLPIYTSTKDKNKINNNNINDNSIMNADQFIERAVQNFKNSNQNQQPIFQNVSSNFRNLFDFYSALEDFLRD